MKTKRLLVLIIVLAGFTAAAVILFIINNGQKYDKHHIKISQKANSSSGQYWEYKMSNETVLKEIDRYDWSLFPLSSHYDQVWVFEPIGQGEVTINWLVYQGSWLNEKKSYSVTYEVDGEEIRLK